MQQVLGLSFQEITGDAVAPAATAELLAGVEERVAEAATSAQKPITAADVAGRRLLVLLFDLSSMQPEEVQRAVDSANTFVKEQMSPADMIAVATNVAVRPSPKCFIFNYLVLRKSEQRFAARVSE